MLPSYTTYNIYLSVSVKTAATGEIRLSKLSHPFIHRTDPQKPDPPTIDSITTSATMLTVDWAGANNNNGDGQFYCYQIV
jgi:hypothetical protein